MSSVASQTEDICHGGHSSRYHVFRRKQQERKILLKTAQKKQLSTLHNMPQVPPLPQRRDSLPAYGATPSIPPVPSEKRRSRPHSEIWTEYRETSRNPRMTASLDSSLLLEPDTFIYEDKHLWKETSKKTLNFYEKGKLCDVEICVGEKTFYCHRLVLACVSHYFRAMFTSEMEESKKGKVTIHDINENAMEKLIQFAYTSKIELTIETVQSILYAASILQMNSVAEACSAFMKQHLHPSNCIDVRSFAEQHNREELMTMADDFILENFLEVKDAEEFKNMSLSLLERVISSPDLNVRNESEVYEAVMVWVKHDCDGRKEHLPKLISQIKLPLLQPTYLMDKVEGEDMMKKSLDCRDLLDEAKYYQMSQANLVPEVKITERSRPRKSYAGVLFCVGGRGAAGDPFKSIECYDPRKNHWFHVSEMNTRRRHVGVCSIGGLLYAVGGHDGNNHLSSGEVFEPKTNKWTSISPMGTPRRGIALSSLGGPMYAVGGLDDTTCFNTVERYDPVSDMWTFVASMQTPRGGVGVAALKAYLYAVGGNDGSSSLDKCERYDPFINKWTTVANMNKRRAGAGVAVLDGHIFAVGGFDDNSPLDSMEKFDPKTGIWTTVASMSTCRGGVGVAALGGKIYAVGGHDGNNYLNSVEVYDPLTDSWQTVRGILLCRAGAGVVSCECPARTVQKLNQRNVEHLNTV